MSVTLYKTVAYLQFLNETKIFRRLLRHSDNDKMWNNLIT